LLLAGDIASRARGSVQTQVLFGRLFFLCGFAVTAWEAAYQLAMPALLADATKGVVAVFTYRHTLRHRWKLSILDFAAWLGSIFFVRAIQVIRHRIFWFWVSLRSCSSLAPLPWTVDCGLVGFNLLLSLEERISLNCFSSQRNLE
jgi:hypothetical protein